MLPRLPNCVPIAFLLAATTVLSGATSSATGASGGVRRCPRDMARRHANGFHGRRRAHMEMDRQGFGDDQFSATYGQVDNGLPRPPIPCRPPIGACPASPTFWKAPTARWSVLRPASATTTASWASLSRSYPRSVIRKNGWRFSTWSGRFPARRGFAPSCA